jgi:FkbM family methyltransferase
MKQNESVTEVGRKLEALIQSIYEGFLQAGNICVDGGAGRGRHTIPMAQCIGSSGSVLAFEPNPATLNILKKRLGDELLDNVILEPLALSNRKETAQFYNVVEFAAYSGLEIRDYPEDSKVEKIPVDAVTLDGHITHAVDFIKLDLEGGEFHALQGGQQLLSSCRPLVVFENGRDNTAKLYGYSKDTFFDFFNSLNYEVYDLLGRRLNPERWTDRNLYWNYVAFHSDDTETRGIVRRLIKQEAPHRFDAFCEDDVEL